MEVNVNVKIELGPQTLALISGAAQLAQASRECAAAVDAVDAVGEAIAAEAPAPSAAEPAAKPAKRAKKEAPKPETAEPEQAEAPVEKPVEAVKPAKAEAATPSFLDLDDVDKMERMLADTKALAQGGRSGDVRKLLDYMEVPRVSALTPDQYTPYYARLLELKMGKPITDVIGES